MIVAGLDEVGRGSIAGPLLVVAAAFTVDDDWTVERACPISSPKIKDSKAYSSRDARVRAAAAIEVEPTFLGRGRGVVTSVDITLHGMTWAIKSAFKRALATLPQVPDLLLVDGEMPVPDWDGKQLVRPKADALWWPVSAASVLAKVERDRWMETLARVYPGYGWETNAGYGTDSHMAAIRAQGSTPVHRKNFIHALEITETSK